MTKATRAKVKNISTFIDTKEKPKFTPKEAAPVEQTKIETPPPFIDPKEKLKRKIEAERVRENKEVRGIFRFHEVPGGEMRFPFRAYPGDKIKTYHLKDGEIYTVPLCVAKHLNKNVHYPVHGRTMSKDGVPIVGIGKTVHRCSFQSLDFIDTGNPDSIGAMGASQIDIVKQF